MCVSACLRFQERLPENELTGTIFMVNAGGSLRLLYLFHNLSSVSELVVLLALVILSFSGFCVSFWLLFGLGSFSSLLHIPPRALHVRGQQARREERESLCVRERERETHAKRHRPFSSLSYVRRLCEHACNTYTRIERSVSRESKPNGLCECFYDGKITLIADNPNNLTTAHINRVCTVGVGGDFELEIQPLQAKQR